jgi:glycosyltransferase involved in cell wall biosynthesis
LRICWSLPVRGERLGSSRGDLVRAASLVAALRQAGHEVTVVEDAARPGSALAVGTYRSLVRRLLPRRAALVLRDAGRVVHARRHAARVVAACRAARAELLIETQVHFAGSGAAAARATGLPLLLDDCTPPSEETALGCGLPRLAARVFRRQVAGARRCLVPSQALARALQSEGVPPSLLRVVPNGVDLALHDAAREQRDALRRRLALDARFAVAFVGSFQPWHDAALLPRALGRLAGGGARGLALVLAGDGPGREACVRAAREVPDLLLVDEGAVAASRVPELLAACDAGALPGTNDYGQPMKLVEYAAARLPCVAPARRRGRAGRVPGPPEGGFGAPNAARGGRPDADRRAGVLEPPGARARGGGDLTGVDVAQAG